VCLCLCVGSREHSAHAEAKRLAQTIQQLRVKLANRRAKHDKTETELMEVITSLKQRLHKHHTHERGYLKQFQTLQETCKAGYTWRIPVQATESPPRCACVQAQASKWDAQRSELVKEKTTLQVQVTELQNQLQQQRDVFAKAAHKHRKQLSKQARFLSGELRQARDTMGEAQTRLQVRAAAARGIISCPFAV